MLCGNSDVPMHIQSWHGNKNFPESRSFSSAIPLRLRSCALFLCTDKKYFSLKQKVVP